MFWDCHTALSKKLIEKGPQRHRCRFLRVVRSGCNNQTIEASFARRGADMIGGGRDLKPPSLHSLQASDPLVRRLNPKAPEESAMTTELLKKCSRNVQKV